MKNFNDAKRKMFVLYFIGVGGQERSIGLLSAIQVVDLVEDRTGRFEHDQVVAVEQARALPVGRRALPRSAPLPVPHQDQIRALEEDGLVLATSYLRRGGGTTSHSPFVVPDTSLSVS